MSTLQPKPVLGTPGDWSFPTFQEGSLTNGLHTMTTHLDNKELLHVEVLLPQGSNDDPQGKEGLATLAVALLDEGTQARASEEFAEALELIGAWWHASASASGTNVGLSVPKENIKAALYLLGEALTTASIPEREFERIKTHTLNGMQSSYANPSSRARLAHLGSIWEEGTRYAVPTTGTPRTVEAITLSDVRNVAASYSPKGARALVAGDLKGLDVPQLLEDALGNWSSEAPAEGRAGTFTALTKPKLVIVDRPGSVQTQLVLGAVSPTRDSSAWPSLQVGSHVLGGGLTSRIDSLLREEKGYTYGMQAQFTPRPDVGSWTISGAVDTGNTIVAVEDLLGLLADVEGSITEDEVAKASSYLVGAAPLWWDQPGSINNQAAALVGAGLPTHWIDTFLSGMKETTAQSVNDALGLLGLTRMSLVAVGDADVIRDGLEKATGLVAEVVSE